MRGAPRSKDGFLPQSSPLTRGRRLRGGLGEFSAACWISAVDMHLFLAGPSCHAVGSMHVLL